MGIIDTHSHIYLDQFDEDRADMIKRARAAGVEFVLMPNIDVDTIDSIQKVEAENKGYCLSMMGLHPTSVDDKYKLQLEVMYDILRKQKFCAIGEVGIDLYWDKTYKTQQIEVFKIQLRWAKEMNLPVVIHVREAFGEVFDVLDNIDLTDIKGVFHSFGGTVEQGRKILDYKNFLLGINGVVTFKNSGLDKVIGELGLENLVLETDAPYLTPTPYRGKRNEPAYLSYIVEKISGIFDVSAENVIDITSKNAKRLFSLS